MSKRLRHLISCLLLSLLGSQQLLAQKQSAPPIHYEYLFVTARSGLNYRDAPKGKLLGKFNLNHQLKIIHYTKIKDQVKAGGQLLDGEWVGVEKEADTVYVFNAFLSDQYVTSDVELYPVSPFYKRGESSATAFVNLSETYWGTDGAKVNNLELGLSQEDWEKDTFRLNPVQKRRFLINMGLPASARLFIYQLDTDSVITYPIKDLPVMICPNPFDRHEIGFDLGKYRSNSDDFAYLGTQNPFQTGKLKPVIWKEIDTALFPKKFDPEIIHKSRRVWFKGYTGGTSYLFKYNSLNYYVQYLINEDKSKHYYLIVLNEQTKKIIFERVYVDSESTHLRPLRTTAFDIKKQYGQWTGELFKNKATVLFGFLGNSFGCPGIKVLDDSEPVIPILCDNRH